MQQLLPYRGSVAVVDDCEWPKEPFSHPPYCRVPSIRSKLPPDTKIGDWFNAIFVPWLSNQNPPVQLLLVNANFKYISGARRTRKVGIDLIDLIRQEKWLPEQTRKAVIIVYSFEPHSSISVRMSHLCVPDEGVIIWRLPCATRWLCDASWLLARIDDGALSAVSAPSRIVLGRLGILCQAYLAASYREDAEWLAEMDFRRYFAWPQFVRNNPQFASTCSQSHLSHPAWWREILTEYGKAGMEDFPKSLFAERSLEDLAVALTTNAPLDPRVIARAYQEVIAQLTL